MPFHPDQLLLYAVTDRAWTGRQTLLEQLELHRRNVKMLAFLQIL